MQKPKRAKVRTVPARGRAPREVPDNKRPLSDHGQNPGGLPPQGFKPGWKVIHGAGAVLHTHGA